MERYARKQRRTTRRTIQDEGGTTTRTSPVLYGTETPKGRLGQVSPKREGVHSETRRKKKPTRGNRGGKKKKEKRTLGKGIFNLSDVTFTEEEMNILDLGLKFAPEKSLDKFETYIDLKKNL